MKNEKFTGTGIEGEEIIDTVSNKETVPNDDLTQKLAESKISELEGKTKGITAEDAKQYEATLKSIKESPEQKSAAIQKEIVILQDKINDWKSIVTKEVSQISEIGMATSRGANLKPMFKKYPGLEDLSNKIDLAKSKNKLPFFKALTGKKPELSDFQFQCIKNYLTTGSMGRFPNEATETKARESVNKFLSEVETTESEKTEGAPKNMAKAIFGEYSGIKGVESKIAELNKELSSLNLTSAKSEAKDKIAA